MKVYDPHILTPDGSIEGQLVDLTTCARPTVPGICTVAVWEIDRYSLTAAIRNGITIYPGWFTPLEKF